MDLKQYVPVQKREYEQLMANYEQLTKVGHKVAYSLPESQIRAIARKECGLKGGIEVDAKNFTNGMNEELIKLYRAALKQSLTEIDQVQTTANELKIQTEDAIEKLTRDAPSDLEEIISRRITEIDDEEIADAEIKILREKQQQSRIEIEQFRSIIGGRNPVTFNKFLYVTIMLAIGSLEFFINISAFNEIFAPAFAVAAAAVIGFMFAYSSHKVGMALRAIPGLKNERYIKYNRVQVYQQFALGLALFVVSFGVVLYFRYDLLQSLFGSAVSGDVGEILGLGAKSASDIILRKIGEVSLLNLGVWLLGVGISWATHDIYPRYPIAVKEADAAERALQKCHRKFVVKRSAKDSEKEKILQKVKMLSAEQKEMANRLKSAIEDLKNEKTRRTEICNEGIAQAIMRYVGEVNSYKGDLSFIKNGKNLSKAEYLGLERKV